MGPIKLTDSQFDAVMRATQPLAPYDRGPFLEALAAALQGQVIGDGTVYRAIASIQRQHFDPPLDQAAHAPRPRQRASAP